MLLDQKVWRGCPSCLEAGGGGACHGVQSRREAVTGSGNVSQVKAVVPGCVVGLLGGWAEEATPSWALGRLPEKISS